MARLRPVILDCDPGQDDAIAILLALAAPDEIDLLGIATVAGNVSGARTALNARKVATLAGRTDIAIRAGCVRPMLREPVTAEHVHGEDGLEGWRFPEPEMELAEGHAVPWLIETLRAADARPVLAATGPLTNVAEALVMAPDIATRIDTIVWMGGSAGPGNVTPFAEFNAFADPHAAAIVFGCGAPIVMFGLDVTLKALAGAEHAAALDRAGTPAACATAGLIRHGLERTGGDGVPLHDPCVIAWLIEPDLFAGARASVTVATESGAEFGRTRVDWESDTPNATVMTDVDAERLFRLLTERLGGRRQGRV